MSLDSFSPAAVAAPAEEAVDTNALIHVMAKAGFGQAPQKKRGGVSLSDIAGAPVGGGSKSQVVAAMAKMPQLSEFTELVNASGHADALARAEASGSEITLFAPTNDAMAKIPGAGLVKLKRGPSHKNKAMAENFAAARLGFVEQHTVKDMDAQLEDIAGEVPNAAIESMASGVHASIQMDPESETGKRRVAVHHDDNGEVSAAAKIGMSLLTEDGHTIHVVENALVK